MLKPNPLLPAVSTLKLPLLDNKKKKVLSDQELLLPHKVWAALYQIDKQAFEEFGLETTGTDVA